MEKWQYVLNLNIGMPFDTGIPLLNIYAEEIHTYVHQEAYISTFLTLLFVRSKN